MTIYPVFFNYHVLFYVAQYQDNVVIGFTPEEAITNLLEKI